MRVPHQFFVGVGETSAAATGPHATKPVALGGRNARAEPVVLGCGELFAGRGRVPDGAGQHPPGPRQQVRRWRRQGALSRAACWRTAAAPRCEEWVARTPRTEHVAVCRASRVAARASSCACTHAQGEKRHNKTQRQQVRACHTRAFSRETMARTARVALRASDCSRCSMRRCTHAASRSSFSSRVASNHRICS